MSSIRSIVQVVRGKTNRREAERDRLSIRGTAAQSFGGGGLSQDLREHLPLPIERYGSGVPETAQVRFRLQENLQDRLPIVRIQMGKSVTLVLAG